MVARRLAAAAMIAAWTTMWAASTALAADPSPSPTVDPGQACQRVSATDAVRAGVRIACDLATGGASGPAHDIQQGAGQAASQLGQAVGDAAEVAFSNWLANGAVWVVQGVSHEVTGRSTTPGLDPDQAAAFARVYGRVVGVALSLSVLLVLIGVIEATLMQRPGGLRRIVVGIAVSGIGLGAVPVGTAVLVRITDDLSGYIAADQSQVVARGFAVMIQTLQQANPATGAAAFAVTAFGIMLAGALLWLELVTRAALIYLFLGVVPLACAAVQWPRLEGVLQKVLFSGVALIVSKLLIAIALAVGFAVLSGSVSLESLLGGMFLLVIAALMPFATARVLPLAAEEMSLGHEGRTRRWLTTGAGTSAGLAVTPAGGGVVAGAALSLARPMGGSRQGPPDASQQGSGPARPQTPTGTGPGAGASSTAAAPEGYRTPRTGEPAVPRDGGQQRPSPGASSGGTPRRAPTPGKNTDPGAR